MRLYLVGQYKGGKTGSVNWDFQGIFDTIEKAEKACIENSYFVAPVVLNKELPEKTTDWKGCYYPNLKES